MAEKKNNAKLPDIATLMRAGIDPRTGWPIRALANANKGIDKTSIQLFLRIIDEQDAVNRYKWTGIPCDLSSQEIERLLYYRGQLAFFYLESADKFYFMPYALDGSLDFYGRYNSVHPIPFADGGKDNREAVRTMAEVLSKIKLNVVRDVIDTEELTDEEYYNLITKSTVLLHDYTKQRGEEIIPRQVVNDWIIQEQSILLPYLDTNLLNGTGVKGLRVQDADQKTQVNDMANAIYNASQNRVPYVATIGNIDFQELGGPGETKPEDYLMVFQSLDNLRLSSYGIENGGLFEKKAHILEAENAVNNSNVSNAFNDGLAIRQHFCDIVNSIYGLNMWCEASENSTNTDLNGDGVLYDGEEESPKEQEQGGVDDGSK